MFKIIIRHGLSREISDELSGETTIAQILENESYRAILKHGENTDAIFSGVIQHPSTTVAELGEDAVLLLETRSNSKA